jgi:hypothetical protein
VQPGAAADRRDIAIEKVNRISHRVAVFHLYRKSALNLVPERDTAGGNSTPAAPLAIYRAPIATLFS